MDLLEAITILKNAADDFVEELEEQNLAKVNKHLIEQVEEAGLVVNEFKDLITGNCNKIQQGMKEQGIT